MKNKGLIKKADIILLAVLLSFAILLYFPRLLNNSGAFAHIYINGEEYAVVSLDKIDAEYDIDLPSTPEIVLRAGKGYIMVLDAGCPDKLCVARGKLSKNGDTAVCVPAETVIAVKASGQSSGVDVIVY